MKVHWLLGLLAELVEAKSFQLSRRFMFGDDLDFIQFIRTSYSL